MTRSAEDESPPAQPEGRAHGEGADIAASPAADDAASDPDCALSFYLFIEPFTAGKVVVDLAGGGGRGGGPGPELLRRAGAVEVLTPATSGLPLPFPSAGVDVVVCSLGPAEVEDDARRSALLAEVRRVLRPGGMLVARVVARVLEDVAVGVSLRAALADLALEHFATVDIIEETPFRAVSYFVPGSDDLAVSEAMSKVGGRPSHLIAFCTAAAERTWHLSESLLVPTGPGDGDGLSDGELVAWKAEVGRLTAKLTEVSRERDDLREREMVVQDRAERTDRTVSTLRKDVERYLRQISDDAAARELLGLERDQVRRKLSAIQEELLTAQHEVEKHKSSVQALRKEVARLRAARAGATGHGSG
jgi:SAM-dependent methyltransferase